MSNSESHDREPIEIVNIEDPSQPVITLSSSLDSLPPSLGGMGPVDRDLEGLLFGDVPPRVFPDAVYGDRTESRDRPLPRRERERAWATIRSSSTGFSLDLLSRIPSFSIPTPSLSSSLGLCLLMPLVGYTTAITTTNSYTVSGHNSVVRVTDYTPFLWGVDKDRRLVNVSVEERDLGVTSFSCNYELSLAQSSRPGFYTPQFIYRSITVEREGDRPYDLLSRSLSSLDYTDQAIFDLCEISVEASLTANTPHMDFEETIVGDFLISERPNLFDDL